MSTFQVIYHQSLRTILHAYLCRRNDTWTQKNNQAMFAIGATLLLIPFIRPIGPSRKEQTLPSAHTTTMKRPAFLHEMETIMPHTVHHPADAPRFQRACEAWRQANVAWLQVTQAMSPEKAHAVLVGIAVGGAVPTWMTQCAPGPPPSVLPLFLEVLWRTGSGQREGESLDLYGLPRGGEAGSHPPTRINAHQSQTGSGSEICASIRHLISFFKESGR
ncbi:hypothetical protein [Dictyobacter alpinus]|uniref:hypothetical protein n=1 Tax=Dictyobacter alpinus TaxID=2014873 RepID=UPI000F840482|nr:hypothetical protein [Dictyobacter alpinus]